MEQSFSHVKAEDENPSFLLKLLKTTDTNTEQLQQGKKKSPNLFLMITLLQKVKNPEFRSLQMKIIAIDLLSCSA